MDNLWYDKFIGAAFTAIAVILGWIATEIRKLYVTNTDYKAKKMLVPMEKRIDEIEDRLRELEIYQEITEKVAKATEMILYNKNL